MGLVRKYIYIKQKNQRDTVLLAIVGVKDGGRGH